MAKTLEYVKLPDGHPWWRVADPAWHDPLNPAYSKKLRGRWNRPGAFLTLYLNEDKQTARCNIAKFIEDKPYEPEDLVDENAPVLIGCRLPKGQVVCDVVTDMGIRAAGLPSTYPLDAKGSIVEHHICQDIGVQVKMENKRGVYARCAKSQSLEDRELAWFPASARSKAQEVEKLSFSMWYF